MSPKKPPPFQLVGYPLAQWRPFPFFGEGFPDKNSTNPRNMMPILVFPHKQSTGHLRVQGKAFLRTPVPNKHHGFAKKGKLNFVLTTKMWVLPQKRKA